VWVWPDSSERIHILRIKDGEVGHSYLSVFRPCLDANVEWVELQDPYLRSRYQVHNLVRFCELLVKACPRLREVRIVTSPPEGGSDTSMVSSIPIDVDCCCFPVFVRLLLYSW